MSRPAPTKLLPEAAVHEFLGIRSLPRQMGVNISIVNWNGRRFLDREDVLRWLRTNAASTDSALLYRLHDELAEATAKGD
jgi:hypothetical protein